MKAIKGNVLFKINVKQKEVYGMDTGDNLLISRGFEFNLRLDRPSRGYCIDGDGIPKDSEILLHHLSIEPNYEVPYAHDYLSEEEIAIGYKIYTVPADMVFAYRITEEGEWVPYKGYLITKRVFKPVESKLSIAKNERIKNRLFVVSGKDTWDDEEVELGGNILIVSENSDYEVIFHDTKNKPQSVIRTRWRELQAIDEGLTKKLKKGLVYLGLNETDCKPMNS